MAITTLAGAVAGQKRPVDFVKAASGTLVAGRPFNYTYTSPPETISTPTGGIGGRVITSGNQLEWVNPTSGYTYLYELSANLTQPGTLMLIDRLWENSGLSATSTSEQTFTDSVDIPARDRNGAALGHGVYAALEVVGAATGAGTPTLTFKYRNQDDVEKTATNIIATVASTASGTFYPLGLAAGDVGVRRAVSLTLSTTWTQGWIYVCLYRPIAMIATSFSASFAPQQHQQRLCVCTNGFSRAYDNTVPQLVFIPNTTSTSTLSGQLTWTQG